MQHLPFPMQFRGANLGTEIVSYNINEMLATKMRALFHPTSPAPSSNGTFSAYFLIDSTGGSSLTESWPEFVPGPMTRAFAP